MKIVMMGTGSFAEPTFLKLLESGHPVVGLVTQPDRATGKERGSTRRARQGMKDIALARGIPVLQPESINTSEGVESLRLLKPDLLVVAAYGQILSRDVLTVPPQGGINVHASLLPKYRGAAPINWAIYNGETQSGVTIIRMSVYLDAGDILAQTAIEILPAETAGELEARLGPLGARLALDTVEKMSAGPVKGWLQDKAQVTKAPKLTKEAGQIAWQRSAPEVCNQIRAMQPWPTAYTVLHRASLEPMRVIIHRARVAPYAPAPKVEGSGCVVIEPDSKLLVRCGEGWVEILELQPAGKRRMSAREFLHGNSLSPDARLA